jgi:hypothetical protein
MKACVSAPQDERVHSKSNGAIKSTKCSTIL